MQGNFVNTMKKIAAVIFPFLLAASCDIRSGHVVLDEKCSGPLVTDETFDEADRPGLEYDDTGDYFLVRPWNYEKDRNASRKYPLLIYLHGASQEGYLKNLYYMGMGYYSPTDTDGDYSAEYRKDIADKFRKTYPCFAFVPQGPGGWNTGTLIAQIAQLKADYRIDPDRIYIHGFSMGGSAIYPLAEAYYEYNGQLFAGMIRLNGYSPVSLGDEIVANTSVWVMVGLGDSRSVIDNIREAYAFLRDHDFNSGAFRSERSGYIVGEAPYEHRADSVGLMKGGVRFALKTEYPDDGHFITEFPFRDPHVFEWLFCQSVGTR